MLAEQRRSLILDIVAEQGSVSVTELYRRLKVSRETIRRDITRLATENRLCKTHGGALSLDSREPAFAERMSVNLPGKRAIGRVAAALVPDGASLIIDAGTTALCVAEALAGLGLDITFAKIATAKALALDVFYVTDAAGMKLLPEVLGEVEIALLGALGDPPETHTSKEAR